MSTSGTLSARPLILYHADCADGFCAAWVAWRKFGDGADYLPVQYGQAPPDVTGRTVYILDFSYKLPVLLELRAKARLTVVLDHHKTAQYDLDPIADPLSPYALDLHHPLSVKFDLAKSGGRLTWEHFFPGKPAPWLVDYTEDRDLWRWRLPNSKAISASLASHPKTFAVWEQLDARGMVGNRPPDALATEGFAILRYQAQLVESHAKNAVEIEIGAHSVLAVNATCLISEIGEQLAQDRPFGATYFTRDDGKRVWSLRSRGPDGVDVSEIAKRRGGGGHRNAAGFTE